VEIKGLKCKELLVGGSRIPVNEKYNQVVAYHNISAVGDVACNANQRKSGLEGIL